MSCSSVTIKGYPPDNIPYKGEKPLLIANLQFNPNGSPQADGFWPTCHTAEGTSVIYPGIYHTYELERGEVALGLTPFPAGNSSLCSSNNQNTSVALSLQMMDVNPPSPNHQSMSSGGTVLGTNATSRPISHMPSAATVQPNPTSPLSDVMTVGSNATCATTDSSTDVNSSILSQIEASNILWAVPSDKLSLWTTPSLSTQSSQA